MLDSELLIGQVFRLDASSAHKRNAQGGMQRNPTNQQHKETLKHQSVFDLFCPLDFLIFCAVGGSLEEECF